MRHVINKITSGHGVLADCWEVNSSSFKKNPDGTYTASGNVSLFYNHQAQLDEKVILDNAIFNFKLTVQEIVGDTEKAIYDRLLLSNIVDGVEMNTLQTSHSGQVTLVGGVYHELI